MLEMILKMSAVTAVHVLLTALLWLKLRKKTITVPWKIFLGLIYGGCAILSTHFGIDFHTMLLNVRDLGPLIAGLFFDPVSGLIAGFMGGIERYIAGTYWGIGSYTRIACSLSTCLAGVLAAVMNYAIFKRRKPSPFYGFAMGAVMEVFHMYAVLITHRSDMSMAFYVVKTCALPMILFTGLGLAGCSITLRAISHELKNPLRVPKKEEVSVAQKFQFWLFGIVTFVLVCNMIFVVNVQSQTAMQDSSETLRHASENIRDAYISIESSGSQASEAETDELLSKVLSDFHVGNEGTFDIISKSGISFFGAHSGTAMSLPNKKELQSHAPGEIFRANMFQTPSLCLTDSLPDGLTLLTQIPDSEMFFLRDVQVYETAFADVILFAVIYVLVYMLVQEIVIKNLNQINASLDKITFGNLDEVISVRSSSEFASLSDDINQTVTALKGYIEAAEKRIEEELELARIIQESSLPKNFAFPRNDMEVFATMDPAKEVGGDFYDLFFVDRNKVVMVIADVSGKGIPASLFMMRAKTIIRGLAESGLHSAEILQRANNSLCEGNEAEMFVTVWIGIVDLLTGHMSYASAGHEYPILMRAGGDYGYVKEKHGLPLACMEGVNYKEAEMTLNAEDRLFVYTDGIPEAINHETAQYGTERLLKVLNATKQKPMDVVLPMVREDIAGFVGEEDQFDDITMLGFVYKGQQ